MFLDGVSLDVTLIEAEQCQTPYPTSFEPGFIDGIHTDEFDNVLWYDVLRYHPGSSSAHLIGEDPIQIAANNMLHWYKMIRPGSHRETPVLKSTLNVGAQFRRFREANLSTAEKVAAYTLFLKTMFQPSDADLDQIDAMSTLDIFHGMLTALPNSMDLQQLKAEHPSPEYADFHRSLVSEQGRPLHIPYNVGACDSSTYSFASGKLDNLLLRAAADIDRADCDEQVLNPLFASWFRERNLVSNDGDQGPAHQWDWPAHPVIDSESEARATETELRDGTTTLREVWSKKGEDYEDQLEVMAQDWFGEASEENITKARQINMLRNVPEHALPFVATLVGIKPTVISAKPTPQGAPA
jgi:capsid protein